MRRLNELALFAGAGGGILGGQLLGWRTRCAVEIDPYARRVLLARQRDGMLPRFPIWDDVQTFDGVPWRGAIDVISGGFPCQDISVAGRGGGIDGARSGLWRSMARIVREVLPRYVFVENSPMLTSRGLGVVLGDLAALGYNARWCVLGARHVGAPHKRDRIWLLATYANGEQCNVKQERRPKRGVTANASSNGKAKQVAHAKRDGLQRIEQARATARTTNRSRNGGNPRGWPIEPAVGRVAHGVARRVDRLKALGNGQVPSVAALAWHTLITDLEYNDLTLNFQPKQGSTHE